ncbi:hypothetical protein SAMN05421874_11690 [Nonomuraea maritima]|uniref:Uncharacterized protein n=1 Tax=Nonomuraea maritima TaxID=683260 RepID=A0A1G9HLH8_9ACTN|nr:hypothetical protein SAMN05421874_11690 [Nonomuraea maritima]
MTFPWRTDTPSPPSPPRTPPRAGPRAPADPAVRAAAEGCRRRVRRTPGDDRHAGTGRHHAATVPPPWTISLRQGHLTWCRRSCACAVRPRTLRVGTPPPRVCSRRPGRRTGGSHARDAARTDSRLIALRRDRGKASFSVLLSEFWLFRFPCAEPCGHSSASVSWFIFERALWACSAATAGLSAFRKSAAMGAPPGARAAASTRSIVRADAVVDVDPLDPYRDGRAEAVHGLTAMAGRHRGLPAVQGLRLKTRTRRPGYAGRARTPVNSKS